MRDKIYEYLEVNERLSPNQHGFRKGRSCLSQLLTHYQKIINALEENVNYDVIYTDFAKAFDKCDHGVLIKKLKAAGISGKIGRWIYNFLTGRKQRVKVNNTLSSESEVKSSVPQETVLAPILFLTLLNDIFESAQYCDMGSFADDTKVSLKIKNKRDTHKLQGDLNNIFKWEEENNMKFNLEKFVSL